VLTALNDPDPALREHGVRLAESCFTNGTPPASLWPRLRQMAGDDDITVRYQLAFTLGEVNVADRFGPLAGIARRDADSAWMRAALLSSLSDGAGELFTTLSADGNFRETRGGREFLRQLIALVGAKNRREEVRGVVDYLSRIKDEALAFLMTHALGEGAQQKNQSLAGLGGGVSNILARACAVADDNTQPEAARVLAVRLLPHLTYAGAGKRLAGLLALPQPQAVQLAALAKFDDPEVGDTLTGLWASLTPRLRAEALPVLLARPGRAMALLRAIEAGAIRAGALDSTQIKLLTTYRDPEVRRLAGKVLAAKPLSARQEVINRLMPALNLAGDAAVGKKIYAERCQSCHRANGEGFRLGPDFVTLKTAGREKLLANLVDPNSEVRPEFIGYVVETKDDQSLLGLITQETPASVTLRQAYGREDVIPRAQIVRLRSQGQSVMPEELEAGLTPQNMADLLEFISTATP
jgi:putative heme-binding domain-containing protein